MACAGTTGVSVMLSHAPTPEECRWHVAGSVEDLPDRPGCYAVYHDRCLAYIGSSVSLARRAARYFATRRLSREIRTQAYRRTPLSLFTVKIAESRLCGDWLMREYRLVTRLKPRDNRMWTGTLRPRPTVMHTPSDGSVA